MARMGLTRSKGGHLSGCGGFDGCHLALVLTFRIGTLQEIARLQILLRQVWTPAIRALFRHRASPRHEGAVRIAMASVERLTALGAPLHNLAFVTFRALHPDGFLLDVLAGG